MLTHLLSHTLIKHIAAVVCNALPNLYDLLNVTNHLIVVRLCATPARYMQLLISLFSSREWTDNEDSFVHRLTQQTEHFRKMNIHRSISEKNNTKDKHFVYRILFSQYNKCCFVYFWTIIIFPQMYP